MKKPTEPKRPESSYPTVEAPHLALVLGQMQMPTAKPCIECPLQKASWPGYLGGYTADQYISILHSDVSIACHRSPGFPHDVNTQRHCTGVCAYRANVGKVPRNGNCAEAVALIGKNSEFFGSAEEFKAYHDLANKKAHGG